MRKAIQHHLRRHSRRHQGIAQKQTETSLIEQFLYPKLGPGQLWEEVGQQIRNRGGEILTNYLVTGVEHNGSSIRAVRARDVSNGEVRTFAGDFFFSTMPVQHLVRAMDPPAPSDIREISEQLVYRDFLTVGLLCAQLKIRNEDGSDAKSMLQDNWIYIQEPDVQVGRLQIFNNWSPYMVSDPTKVWIGLEYFCNEGDSLWSMSDQDLIRLGTTELAKIRIIEETDVLDGTVIRMDKTYPAYFGSYNRFPEVRRHFDAFENLYLIGRNGMHKYNNQDHSMLTAMVAVDNIVKGSGEKDNIWSVNTEQEYHEEK